jgi:hypothetical protein
MSKGDAASSNEEELFSSAPTADAKRPARLLETTRRSPPARAGNSLRTAAGASLLANDLTTQRALDRSTHDIIL